MVRKIGKWLRTSAGIVVALSKKNMAEVISRHGDIPKAINKHKFRMNRSWVDVGGRQNQKERLVAESKELEHLRWRKIGAATRRGFTGMNLGKVRNSGSHSFDSKGKQSRYIWKNR